MKVSNGITIIDDTSIFDGLISNTGHLMSIRLEAIYYFLQVTVTLV
ncbi:MAG: hypothetical protein ACREV6_17955 [Clostridium sp.]